MRQPFPTLMKWGPPLVAAFGLGIALAGGLIGVALVGVPTPDASPEVRRREDRITNVSGATSVVGLGLNLVGLAVTATRAIAGRSRPLSTLELIRS